MTFTTFDDGEFGAMGGCTRHERPWRPTHGHEATSSPRVSDPAKRFVAFVSRSDDHTELAADCARGPSSAGACHV